MPPPAATEDPAATVRLPIIDLRTVPLDSLRPNPWNPNKQSPRTFQAVKESIETYGFIDPCTVRPHPTKGRSAKLVPFDGDGFTEDAWQIIDSEHRVRAAHELGYTVVSINNIGPVDDTSAKKLTVILNETRGDAEVVVLGQLLASIQDDPADLSGLLNALPYDAQQLQEFLRVGDINWDTFRQDDHRAVVEHAALTRKNQHTEFLSFTKAQRERFTTLVAMHQKELGEDATVEDAVLSALERSARTL